MPPPWRGLSRHFVHSAWNRSRRRGLKAHSGSGSLYFEEGLGGLVVGAAPAYSFQKLDPNLRGQLFNQFHPLSGPDGGELGRVRPWVHEFLPPTWLATVDDNWNRFSLSTPSWNRCPLLCQFYTSDGILFRTEDTPLLPDRLNRDCNRTILLQSLGSLLYTYRARYTFTQIYARSLVMLFRDTIRNSKRDLSQPLSIYYISNAADADLYSCFVYASNISLRKHLQASSSDTFIKWLFNPVAISTLREKQTSCVFNSSMVSSNTRSIVQPSHRSGFTPTMTNFRFNIISHWPPADTQSRLASRPSKRHFRSISHHRRCEETRTRSTSEVGGGICRRVAQPQKRIAQVRNPPETCFLPGNFLSSMVSHDLRSELSLIYEHRRRAYMHKLSRRIDWNEGMARGTSLIRRNAM